MLSPTLSYTLSSIAQPNRKQSLKTAKSNKHRTLHQSHDNQPRVELEKRRNTARLFDRDAKALSLSLLTVDRYCCSYEGCCLSRRRQIPQSGAESQWIAVRKLLYQVQHSGWYVSRLQTIRCDRGGVGCSASEKANIALRRRTISPRCGFVQDLTVTNLASRRRPHTVSLPCLDGILP